MYARIENNEIVEILRTLPRSTQNISGLHNLSEQDLRAFGFYPVIGQNEPLKDWQEYGEPTYTIGEKEVIESKEIVDIPLEEYKERKIRELSQRTQATIYDRYSEQEQTNLIREGLRLQNMSLQGLEVSQERVQAVMEADMWIESERAKYRTIKEQIQEATDYNVIYELGASQQG